MPRCQSSAHTSCATHWPAATTRSTPRGWRRYWRTAGYTVCAAMLQLHGCARTALAAETGCSNGTKNALSELACELASQIALPGTTLVVAGMPAADAELTDGSRLAGRISSVIASGFGSKAKGHPAAATV